MLLILFIIPTLVLFAISYFFFDHTLMFILSQDKPYILNIEILRQFLFANRNLITNLFLASFVFQGILQLLLLKAKINTKKAFVISAICILIASVSYNFLSRDIFSYIFWAKIFAIYKQNPYTVTTEVFRNTDWWVSFIHWTHNNYQYGPVYLLYSSIPFIIFGGNRFISIYFFLKLLNAILFFVAGLFLYKIRGNDKKVFALWLFNPFLYIELLTNSHNELLMIFLFILSIWLWDGGKKISGFFVYLLSGLTKYISFPFGIIILLNKNLRSTISIILINMFLVFLGLRYSTSQVWYFTWIYILLPFAKLKTQSYLVLFVFQTIVILDKYLGFVKTGSWGSINIFYSQMAVFLTPLLIIYFEKDKIILEIKKYYNDLIQ